MKISRVGRYLPPIALALSLVVSAGPARAGVCYKYRGLDKKFARKTNSSRSNHSVGRLRLDPHLSKVARKHTKEMLARNSLYHTPLQTLGRRVTRWVALGENIGTGGSVGSLQKAFMNSPSHRANVLNPAYRYVGVGALRKNGRIWVTVVFESRENPGTRLRMPRC